MPEPITMATMAMTAVPMLGKLMGGGGAAPSITKQDNYQNTTLNVSVGGFGDAVRASVPFPGAVPASFATPVGFSGYSVDSVGAGGLDDLAGLARRYWPALVLAGGVVLVARKMRAA